MNKSYFCNSLFLQHLAYMQLPYFYETDLNKNDQEFILSETTNRHCVQVLRMREGNKIQLLNGKGLIATAEIKVLSKKQSVVHILEINQEESPGKKIHIAISLIKNNSRFEWFLEKAVEIGATEITPIICEHTEKQHYRIDRMQQIVISAMLQSRRMFLPLLHESVLFNEAIKNTLHFDSKFIAHCDNSAKKLLMEYCPVKKDVILLIGPEGDFSQMEITLALENNFVPVSLGENRLRTETAGIYGCVLLSL